ncbi:hypothetical protein DIS24_g5640 [Lasiodiplodia hormozganensis]|uniref:Uncharacterized protein n=1 Tax=Lasiodiplodia hormozganensis TaxID=869390 RepID=A0AA39YL21_9PEZI|nr:hypothetical protein DIS24_g5640 [Lasiodiplodia hormozganensis]
MASEAPLLRRMTNEPVRTPTTKSQTTLRAQSSPPLQSPPHTPQHNIWYRIKRALTRTKPAAKVTPEAASDCELHPTNEKESRPFNSWSTGATKLFRRDRSGSESTAGANTDDNGGYVVTPASTLSSHRHHLCHPKPQHDDSPSFSDLGSPSRAINEQAAQRETCLQDTERSNGLFLRAPPFRHRQREKRTPVWEVFALEEPTDEEQARRAFALVETCGAETARSGNPLAADRRRFDEGGEDEDGGEAPVRRPVLGARF